MAGLSLQQRADPDDRGDVVGGAGRGVPLVGAAAADREAAGWPAVRFHCDSAWPCRFPASRPLDVFIVGFWPSDATP